MPSPASEKYAYEILALSDAGGGENGKSLCENPGNEKSLEPATVSWCCPRSPSLKMTGLTIGPATKAALRAGAIEGTTTTPVFDSRSERVDTAQVQVNL